MWREGCPRLSLGANGVRHIADTRGATARVEARTATPRTLMRRLLFLVATNRAHRRRRGGSAGSSSDRACLRSCLEKIRDADLQL